MTGDAPYNCEHCKEPIEGIEDATKHHSKHHPNKLFNPLWYSEEDDWDDIDTDIVDECVNTILTGHKNMRDDNTPERYENKTKEAGVPTSSDLYSSFNLERQIEKLKHLRKARGEIDNVEVLLEVYPETDAGEEGHHWVIEAHLKRDIQTVYDSKLNKQIAVDTAQLTSSEEFESAGEAYLEFEYLVENHNLEEATNPNKNPFQDEEENEE